MTLEPDPHPDERPDEHPDEGRPYPDPAHSLAPRRPRTVGGVFFLGVLATAGLGLGLVALGSWRTGLAVIGCGMVGGALARLVIPRDRAGMLGIRRKFVDVATLLVIGGALLALSLIIDDRPFV
jgi:hypothetical protein